MMQENSLTVLSRWKVSVSSFGENGAKEKVCVEKQVMEVEEEKLATLEKIIA